MSSNNDVEEAVPTTQEQPQSTKPSTKPDFGLSIVSKAYDVNGDGVLDEAEKALRDLDKTGRGTLTNSEMYGLMKENLSTQRELFKVKKIVMGLVAFTVILALSNLGTSFAAAFLAKDTTTQNDQLVDAKTNAVIATQTTREAFTAKVLHPNDQGGERRVQACDVDRNGADCVSDTFLGFSTDDGEDMIDKCKRGKSVILTRTWSSGDETQITICPAIKGDYSRNGPTARLVTANGLIEIKPNTDDLFDITGDGATSDIGGFCDAHTDCDTNLICNERGNCEPEISILPVLQDIGGTCSSSSDCATGTCLTMQYCFAAPCDGTCVCGSDSDCGSGEVCAADCNLADMPPYCTTTKYLDNECAQMNGGDTSYVCNLETSMCGVAK